MKEITTIEAFSEYLRDHDVDGKYSDIDACDDCPCHITCEFFRMCLSEYTTRDISCEDTFRIHHALRYDPETFCKSVLFFNEINAFVGAISKKGCSDKELADGIINFFAPYSAKRYYKILKRRERNEKK